MHKRSQMLDKSSDDAGIKWLILLEERNRAGVSVRMIGITIGALVFFVFTGDPISRVRAIAYISMY